MITPARLAATAAVVGSAFIFAAGCGGTEPEQQPAAPAPEPAAAVEPAAVESAPAPDPAAERRGAARTAERPTAAPPAVADDGQIARRVKRELRAQFGPAGLDAMWYGLIGEVTVTGGDASVETALYRDSDADGPANAICTVIGPGMGAVDGVDSGRVLGSDGGVVKRCGS